MTNRRGKDQACTWSLCGNGLKAWRETGPLKALYMTVQPDVTIVIWKLMAL